MLSSLCSHVIEVWAQLQSVRSLCHYKTPPVGPDCRHLTLDSTLSAIDITNPAFFLLALPGMSSFILSNLPEKLCLTCSFVFNQKLGFAVWTQSNVRQSCPASNPRSPRKASNKSSNASIKEGLVKLCEQIALCVREVCVCLENG